MRQDYYCSRGQTPATCKFACLNGCFICDHFIKIIEKRGDEKTQIVEKDEVYQQNIELARKILNESSKNE